MHTNWAKTLLLSSLWLLVMSCTTSSQREATEQSTVGSINISENDRYFTDESSDPFFWLGDTGWLLFAKLNREDAVKYLEDRKAKGFNVIQVMVLHHLGVTSVYGDSALVNQNVAQPNVTEGADPKDSLQYDYWDHVDFIVEKAADLGLQMAFVPVWGNNVKHGHVSRQQGTAYAEFLAKRYKDDPNIIWLNGGDTFGSDSTQTWNNIGNTLQELDTNHLVTFHPRGRQMSSTWFHDAEWLDFNMFQSGHRRYDQDTAQSSHRFGPDNWKYVKVEYNKKPVKPTVDGEPSYEGIPEGLHDPSEPYWEDHDVRRYGYWAIFAGAAGYTYGHNAIMQFYKPEDEESAYGAKVYWTEALNAPGAQQMVHMKNLMLSKPYFERVPDQSLIANQGEKYDYLIATRGKDYAFIYDYTGREMEINMGKINGEKVKASWFSPRDGKTTAIGEVENQGTQSFDPPGEKEDGNDWVLILETV